MPDPSTGQFAVVVCRRTHPGRWDDPLDRETQTRACPYCVATVMALAEMGFPVTGSENPAALDRSGHPQSASRRLTSDQVEPPNTEPHLAQIEALGRQNISAILDVVGHDAVHPRGLAALYAAGYLLVEPDSAARPPGREDAGGK